MKNSKVVKVAVGFGVAMMMTACGNLASLAGSNGIAQGLTQVVSEQVMNLPLKNVLTTSIPGLDESLTVKEAIDKIVKDYAGDAKVEEKKEEVKEEVKNAEVITETNTEVREPLITLESIGNFCKGAFNILKEVKLPEISLPKMSFGTTVKEEVKKVEVKEPVKEVVVEQKAEMVKPEFRTEERIYNRVIAENMENPPLMEVAAAEESTVIATEVFENPPLIEVSNTTSSTSYGETDFTKYGEVETHYFYTNDRTDNQTASL
jgi:hypothetical protein